MISIVITTFNEPFIYKAIDAILFQKINEKYELIVVAPDKETENLVNEYKRNYPQIKFFRDEGKGKSRALNKLFPKLKGDILILSDGDVFLDNGAINEIIRKFKDQKVGCVTGRVMCENPRYTKFGYWGKLLADVGAHRIRKKHAKENKLVECSGYLFAFKNNGVIKKIPEDVAEDAIIPYCFWKKGYKTDYVENARVFVKNPTNIKDWLKQRKRTAKAHTRLRYYAPDFPKVKSFRNEARKGLRWVWSYPRNLRELIWTIELVFVRLYMWTSVYFDEYITKKKYQDGWERVTSTKL